MDICWFSSVDYSNYKYTNSVLLGMYGRGNIFTRSSATNNSTPAYNSSNTGYNSGGNGYSSNNGYNSGGYNANTGYNSNSNNGGYNSSGGYNNFSGDYRQNGGKLGSYRTDYRYEEPPSYISSAAPVWKEYPPATILSKEEVLHFTPAELRIQDYYLMSKRNLKPIHEQRLCEAIRKQCFNQQLLRTEGCLPPISQERGEDIDALRHGRNQSNSSYNTGYNTGGYNNSGGYNNNSSYNTRGNDTANIFNRNSNSSTNVFMSNNNSNSANIFNGNRNGGGNSGYNSGYNNTSNNGYNNTSNNAGYNPATNIFGNNNLSRSTTGNNIFTNNGNNVSGGNNVFNNSSTSRNPFNSNGNSGGNNIFNQNNNNSRNIFGGNGGGNNVFANNNNTGNNIFNNNRNLFGNNGGQNNNIFGNSMNNNGNNLFGNNPSVIDNLQQFLQENRQFLQILSSKMTEENPPPAPKPQTAALYEPLFKEDDLELFEIDSWVKPDPPAQRVIKINKAEKFHDTMSEGGGRSQRRDNMGSSRLTSNGGRKITYSRVVNKSYQIEEQEEQLAQSGIGPNIPASDSRSRNEKSMVQSRRLDNDNSRIINNQRSITNNSRSIANQPQYSRQTNINSSTGHFQMESAVDPSLVSDNPCLCRIKLSIVWQDDVSNGMKKVDIQQTVQLPNFKPADDQWNKQFINFLKERHPQIRKNSQLIIQNCRKDPSKQQFLLEGELHQRIFNIDSSYRVNYSILRNSYANNLSISNEFGTVSWERPINVEQIDFKDEDEFALEDNTISCDLSALRGKCRVTFNNIPQAIKTKMAENFENAKAHFASIVEQHSEGRFRLQDMWQEGDIYGWSMMVTAFSE